MIEINGMAHVILTVSSFERALKFYGQLLPFLGLKQIFEGDNFAYWVGGRTALGIQRCDEAHRGETFVQTRVGLHHLCFRARSPEDIDTAAQFLREMGATIVRGPLAGGLGAGVLLCVVRRPRPNPGRNLPRAGRRRAGTGGRVRPGAPLHISRSGDTRNSAVVRIYPASAL